MTGDLCYLTKQRKMDIGQAITGPFSEHCKNFYEISLTALACCRPSPRPRHPGARVPCQLSCLRPLRPHLGPRLHGQGVSILVSTGVVSDSIGQYWCSIGAVSVNDEAATRLQ